jgi:hypothetical protein
MSLNGYPVTTSTFTWEDLVAYTDREYTKKDYYVYEFSDGRQFDSTDHTDSGIYDGT